MRDEQQGEKMQASMAARHAAIMRLRELHPEDWKRIYTEEAAKRGVKPSRKTTGAP